MTKLRCKKGFTLIEMLACVLTLIMITLICTTGLNMAMKSYNESLFESNSQMLESTLNTSIGDILRYSYNVYESGSSVNFSNQAYGVDAGGIKLNADGRFVLVKNATTESLLLGSNVYAGNLYIDEFELDYDDATGVFTGSYVIMSNATAGIREVNFTFKSIVESI